MKELELTNAEEYFHGSTTCWRVTYRKEDGTNHTHVFPKDTFDWRAAEYDIDPADIETLMDVVLHEPYVDPMDTAVREAGKLSPALQNNKTTRRGEPEPTNLFNAESISEAREAHLLRIEDAKTNRVNIRAPKGADPRDEIRNKYRVNRSAVAEKKQLVTEGRRLLREGIPIAVPDKIRKEA
jgi:hypothetical protein